MIRKLLEAKRPLEFDRRFKPLTDTNAESFGFPSLESYMAVVISLALAEKFPYLWFYCVAFVVTFLVGFTRIFSRARFPHQIAGSYMLGYVGFKLVNRYVLSNLTMKKYVYSL